MKKYMILTVALLLSSAVALQAQNNITKTMLKLQGVEMVETMSANGMSMEKRPYRWFAGMAESDLQSVAVEMAQLEAYAAVSRVIENIVSAKAERATLGVDGRVQKAIKSFWEQMSMSIQHACEPFGNTEVSYNRETGLYEVIAKVGIRGDRYVKLLDGARDTQPEGLSAEEAQTFIDINETIIDAAKGN